MSTSPLPQADAFHVYDTTLRDGAQREGISYSVNDKLAVARLLDDYGVGFIEGGWPGALPKDTEFFQRAQSELQLKYAVPPARQVWWCPRTSKCGRCWTPEPR
jgi:2-isopropylmalate synthase